MAKFKVGDRVKFDVAGQPTTGRVRQVMFSLGGKQDYDVQLDDSLYYTYRFEQELELVKEEKTYKIGDRFMVEMFTEADEFMLVQVAANQVCLVETQDGNRLVDSKPVKNVFKITEAEMKEISADLPYREVGAA